MKIVDSFLALGEQRKQYAAQKVVFVPTMGALHAGHCALIREARSLAGEYGVVVVSIFVNPIQFDRQEDLENYPETLEQDLAACAAAGVDMVFTPLVEELVPVGRTVTVVEGALSQGLCGASRAGHFDGVCTIVLKLYHLVQPEVMVFGEKDFQQIAIIRKMVEDLNMPAVVHGVATVRELDGLAMSSRNVRLTEEQRLVAPEIYKVLQELKVCLEAGELSPLAVEEEFGARLQAGIGGESGYRVDYAQLVDAEVLTPVGEDYEGGATLGVAIFLGGVRLIDHISVDLRRK